MNSLPYHKRYHRDFLEGTAGMPFEVKGAYSVLLDVIYLHEGAPDDAKYISGQLGCSVRKWNSIRSDLIARGKIKVENGIISTSRADKEIIIQRKWRDQKAENARGSNDNSDLDQATVGTKIIEPEPDIDKKEKNPPNPPRGEADEDFERFWKAYPKKADKPLARRSWKSALKKTDAETLISAAMAYAASPDRKPDFTKNPSTWLRAGSWENDVSGHQANGAFAMCGNELLPWRN